MAGPPGPASLRRLASMLGRADPAAEGEFWDAERLHLHGLELAMEEGRPAPEARRVNLRAHLAGNARSLRGAYQAIVTALQSGRAISPAAEWIVDNFHVVAEQLGDAPLRMTVKVWKRLPSSTSAASRGWPRIHRIATEYLRRTLWDFQPDSLQRMLEGFQLRAPLRMQELWALYPVLRFALIDELASVAIRVEDSLAARAAADAVADSLVDGAGAGSGIAAGWIQQALPLPFTVQLVQRLRGMGERGRPLLDALADALGKQGTSIDECIQRQHARRSSSNVAARNIITSLRLLGSYDWRLLFERASLVEQALREQRDYTVCDRRTRDRYRHSIEDLARAAGREELAITREALVHIAAAGDPGSASDLGAWLIGERRLELEAALRCPVPAGKRLRRGIVQRARGLYLGGIAVFTAALVAAALRYGVDQSGSGWQQVLLAVLATFPASELAMAVLNRFWLHAFPPRHLPRHALESGLGEDMRTLVVIPVLLRSPSEAEAACHQLQVHALANEDPQVFFALLSDWADSPTPVRDDDAAILEAARRGIAALNAAAGAAPETRFYLLHRRRQWSRSEGCYIGWERKRGKLEELNRLLMGRGPTSFVPNGDVPRPRDIRYVLTVDADTRLPLGSVRDLVGVATHPLNRPVFDDSGRRVVRGYGVLQPRITPLLPETEERSLYREIITSGSGIDPYASAVSDLYQDVFGEGLFTGKGLYDLAAWEAALSGRSPPESMLSHDLFEGVFARCALVSDIEFFEDFPSNSEVAAARSHRWMRGDWQLLPWISGRQGPLPRLARWKMLDNLRRVLLAPCSLALLVAAFALASTHAFPWVALVIAPLVWPALSTAVERLAAAPGARSRRMHLYRIAADLASDLGRAGVWLAMLAQNSWLAVDASLRALFRLVSRRHLLEWVTAAQLKSASDSALSSFVWPLKSASIVVIGAAAVLVLVRPAALAAFSPLLLLWWLTPVIAKLLSRPLDRRAAEEELPEEVEQQLRATARHTWTFFEQHVTAMDHHLPPDNFQETPAPVLAHRTSPTNIGLYLLSSLAARDFGWLGLRDLGDRLAATLQTLQSLERYQGHFYNWYDTRTLAPLPPAYVSTVDSGNLAGHLLTLRQACLQCGAGPLLSPRALSGPRDALLLARRAVLEAAAEGRLSPDRTRQGLEQLDELARQLSGDARTLGQLRERVLDALGELSATLLAHTELPPPAARYLKLVRDDLASQLRDIAALDLDGGAERSQLGQLDCNASLPQLAALTGGRLAALADQFQHMAILCERLFAQMSFAFLYDRRRGLFSIGYRVADRALDEGYYDLLASEARLASLVAIARGDAPRSHWFRLGRRLTGGSARPVLASWSGSMFEYLMPALVMREPRYSLLDQTNRRVVRQQIRYGEAHDRPWGVSESAYNVRDREYTYQYSGFGVPDLGLKRGLSSDYVVAPYATALAAMFCPTEAGENYRLLAAAGARGVWGFYESLDYTASRVPEGQELVVVRAYMAHHQGMSLVALDNVLHEGVMQQRFHRDPRVAAAELLLQERRIRFVEAPAFIEADVPATRGVEDPPDVSRQIEGTDSPVPVMHLLSNRRYTVMLTDSGAGFSTCEGRAVTRWREDATRDCWGSFIYVRDLGRRRLWSTGFQPVAAEPDDYRVQFNEECAAISRRDGVIRTTMSVTVSPDDDCELRQVVLHNQGNRSCELEVTSYAEIVLAPQRADVAHAAFSNLFVQTQFVPESGALLAMRRPRSSREAPHWAAHTVCGEGVVPLQLQYETDRARFLGRGRGVRSPLAMEEGRTLSDTVGNVLDPVFALRARVSIPPRSRRTLTFATFVAGSRAQVLALAAKYRNPALFEHVVQSAWTFARADLHHLRSSLAEAKLFQALVAHLLQGTRDLRSAEARGAGTPDLTQLWRLAISGDRPILLIRSHSLEDLGFIRQCLRGWEYLRSRQVAIDLVILNERRHSYVQDFQQSLVQTVAGFRPPGSRDAQGEIHVLAAESIDAPALHLLLSLARVVLDPSQGNLQELLSRPPVARPMALPEPRKPALLFPPTRERGPVDLDFFNGWGGFRRDTGEYQVRLAPAVPDTPAPWSNVMANWQFGSLVTERGSMCTWSLNSRENQLTPWSNDPVSDVSGECFYLLDEEGELWSPAPQPIRRPEARYDIRHGRGYSRFDVSERGIASELTVFVHSEDPVKICQLKLRNDLPERRRLRVVAYVEWVLGAARAETNHNLATWRDTETGALFARNPALIDFGERVAFCDFGGRQQFCTDSRLEFLGRNGSPELPAGLAAPELWRVNAGPGNDPCCAFALELELEGGAGEELVFVLGQAPDAGSARALVLKHRREPVSESLREVQGQWQQVLGSVQIRTPDHALDLLFNHWLLYQVLACRLWGRAGFYQAGGAFGFRDQLQDVMALVLAAPDLARAQLLRAAARQFIEGDVQHWWHPPSGRGVRTHISDDRVWLPYVACHYVACTGDRAVLDEPVSFIEGPPLAPHQEDAHYVPEVSHERASLYEHCVRALERSLATGVHGLPLMGGGDWNDGMNRVGHEGRGESVWLAWFLIATLKDFIPLARERRDHRSADRWARHAQQLAEACGKQAWDGEWYRRAYFDDGTPLGTAGSEECRIDSIAQSWAVLSGAADSQRADAALASATSHLVREEEGMALLFTPPFDKAAQDPGYIKGYLPGLRENGGQYTHAAIWLLMAQAVRGNCDEVASLLRILNPVHRSATPQDAQRYRVEPYVLAADIYSGEANTGRGGWTWYTGAAGWMYRAVLEFVLGIRVREDWLEIDPCVPRDWPEFEVKITLPGIDYRVRMQRAEIPKREVLLDGARAGARIQLRRDGVAHEVLVRLP